MIRTLPIIIIGLVISTMLSVESFVAVYSQNGDKQPITGTARPGSDSRVPPRMNNLIIDDAGGGFTSLQTDPDNITWIATGKWDLSSHPNNSTGSNSSGVQFNATIHTRRTDNSQGHEHKISNFNFVNSSISSSSSGSIIVLNGTASIDTDIGLRPDVPISIRITDEGPAILSIGAQSNEIKPQWIPRGGTIALLIDESAQDHFGNTPVYGDVKGEK
jgi:hypothetical protein